MCVRACVCVGWYIYMTWITLSVSSSLFSHDKYPHTHTHVHIQHQEKRIEDAIRSIRQQYEDVLERKQEEYVEKYKHLQYIEVKTRSLCVCVCVFMSFLMLILPFVLLFLDPRLACIYLLLFIYSSSHLHTHSHSHTECPLPSWYPYRSIDGLPFCKHATGLCGI